MVLPVERTFVHFRLSGAAMPRSKSAPPEVWTDVVLARARRREQLLKRRRSKRLNKVAKIWGDLVEKVWHLEEHLYMVSIHDVVSKRIELTTPRLRERLESRIYQEFACVMFPERRQERLLMEMGVIRERAHEVQFWCADEPMRNPTMIALVELVRNFRQVAESGCIQIIMMGQVPLVFKLGKSAKKNDLQQVVLSTWHIPPLQQVLLHIGKVLKPGPLCQSLCPGACVLVSKRDLL